MWHQITLPGDPVDAALEQMRLMNVLGSSLMKMNLEVAQRIGSLRSAGLPVNFTTAQAEIYVDHDKGKLIWLLNDAAVEACRRLGEHMLAEATFDELPNPPRGLLARSMLLRAPLYSINT